MKYNFNNNIIATLATIIAFPTLMIAQTHRINQKDTTMNRTVVVENEYTPDIQDAQKINILPQIDEPIAKSVQVEYSTKANPVGTLPEGTIELFQKKENQPDDTPGILRVGYGNKSNTDILGNYLFNLSDNDKLNLNFNFNGMNGDLDPVNGDTYRKWDAFYFRTNAAANYTHNFQQMDFDAASHFGLSNFNYKPNTLKNKQKFTSGDIHLGIHSTDETLKLLYRAETNLMFYQRQHNFFTDKSFNETLIRTKATITKPMMNEQQIAVTIKLNNYIYSATGLDNYTSAQFNPFYELDRDNVKIHLGVHADFSTGVGNDVLLAPDMTVQFIPVKKFVVYGKATGGKTLNDFRKMEQLCPYGDYPESIDAAHTNDRQMKDTYNQIDASAGFKTSPIPGIWFHLYAGYQNLKNDIFCIQETEVAPITYGVFEQAKTNNTYVGAEFKYNYRELITFSASGIYRNWDSPNEYALIMKTALQFTANASAYITPALFINLGYNHESRVKTTTEYGRRNPINNLHLEANYKFYKGISFYARANNLLDKDYEYYLMYPTEGLNFVGGMIFKF